MLYIIGLGLADERDISTKGLEIVRKAERVYLEAYTAVLLVEKEQLVRLSVTSHSASTLFAINSRSILQ
jgi:diphthamide biosynthesis methyltransferase